MQQQKIERAIKLLHAAGEMAMQHGQPLEVCYSGGKDSDVILELTRMAGVQYRAIYKNTTIDPPGTLKHVRDMGVEIMRPKMSFREIIALKGFPSRFRRTCCSILKEYKLLDYSVVGIRKDESWKRAKLYHEPEICKVYSNKEKVRQYLPILDWTSEDVAEFIAERGIVCHPLYYDELGNFHPERRLGCVCCPLQSPRLRRKQFEQFPKMVKFYVEAGKKYFQSHPNSKSHSYFHNVYEWFTFDLFCHSIADFRERFGANLFYDGVDCKRFLESTFNISL